MIEIKTRFGSVFIDESAADDKVRIYDSEHRYMDYIEKETVEERAEHRKISFQEVVQEYAFAMQSSRSIEALVDQINYTWDCISRSWEDIASFLNKKVGEEIYNSPESLLSNEYVNKIGDYYIVVTEE